MSTQSAFCGESAKISGFSAPELEFGCVETRNPTATFIPEWTLRSPVSTQYTIVDGGDEWRLHIIKISENSKISEKSKKSNGDELTLHLARKYWEFPINATTLAFTEDVIKDFAETSDEEDAIKIHCTKCDQLFFLHDEGMGGYATKESNSIFSLKPSAVETITFVGECVDASKAFCSVKQDYSSYGLALIEYPSSDGITEAAYLGVGSLMQGGFKRQIIYDRQNVKYYKQWIGTPTIIASNLQKSDLTFKTNDNNDGTLTICAYFGDLQVPFNINLFNQDPEGFFTKLGIPRPQTESQDGYNSNVLNMTDDGTVIVKKEYFVQPSQWDSNLVDIPLEYLNNYPIQNSSKNPSVPGKNDHRTRNIIIGCSAGIVFVVILVIAAVFVVRKKKNSLPLSTQELLTQSTF